MVSGGRNPIRDYVKSILEATESTNQGCVLRARLNAIPKAITVAEAVSPRSFSSCHPGGGSMCSREGLHVPFSGLVASLLCE